MEHQLTIISPQSLQGINSAEINAVIDKMVIESRENAQEIEQLTLESVALMTSAEARTKGLQNQKTLKRLFYNFTGKNDKIRTAVTQDIATAQYMAQQTINRVLVECSRNQELALAVNDRISQCVLDLETQITDVAGNLVQARQAIVFMFQDYTKKIEEQGKVQAELQTFAAAYCPKCRYSLKETQIICPACGEIHVLKLKSLDSSTKAQVQDLSSCIKDCSWNPEIYWDATAARYAKNLHKAQQLAKRADISITPSVQDDIDLLIKKCRSAEFQIAVVGILKAGKSTLLNALIGADLAPTGLNSTTAALTKFRSSRQGHYVTVHFHTPKQWEALLRSAAMVKTTNANSFAVRAQQPAVKARVQTLIGHAPMKIHCKTLQDLQGEIARWVAADSPDHLCVSSLEVGIDQAWFDMPEDVVFVDTPGLEDPVVYRSNITKKYIRQANAVLIAIRPTALTVEGYNAISTVLDYSSGNTKKVYLVGTQKDTLQTGDDYNELIEGTGGWVEKLYSSKRYATKKEIRSHIFTTSAYLHLCMRKALHFSEEQLDNQDLFSNDEYNNLTNSIGKILGKRRYCIEDLRDEPSSVKKAEDHFGIISLKQRLDSALIQQYRRLKIEEIQEQFSRCQQQLKASAALSLQEKKSHVITARQGATALKERQIKQATKLKSLEKERAQIQAAVNALNGFTNSR